MSEEGKKFTVKNAPGFVSDSEFYLPEGLVKKMKKDLEMQMAKVIPVAKPYGVGMQGKVEQVYDKGKWKVVESELAAEEVKPYISVDKMSITAMMAYDLANTYGIDKTSYEKFSAFLLVWMGLEAELYSIRKNVVDDLFTSEQTSMRFYGGPMSGQVRATVPSYKKLTVPVQIAPYDGVSFEPAYEAVSAGPTTIKQFNYLNIQGKWSDRPLTERSWILA